MGQLPPTTRLGLPGPDEHNPANVPVDIDALRQKIDQLAMIYLQGVTSARPGPGVPGRLYFSTDEHLLYYDDGSVWRAPATPTGALQLTAAAAAIAGWLICDGAAYPRAEYSALFAVIGTAWGAGDGSSTFNVPDLRGRAPIGVGEGRAVGAKGGAASHTLTAAESGTPEHQHHMDSTGAGGPPPNVFALNGKNQVRGDNAGGGGNTSLYVRSDGAYSSGIGVAGVVNGAQSASAALSLMQPYAVVNYLIKT
jgi:microcystin-dependent protein